MFHTLGLKPFWMDDIKWVGEKLAMKTSDKMEKILHGMPNGMADEWTLLKNIYPSSHPGDKSNGGRMGCIRRIARNDARFIILGPGASTIALSN